MKRAIWILLLVGLLLPALANAADPPSIDQETGLVLAPGFEQVKKTCTACHSAMLITQNKAERDGWLEMIRWMQAKQGLWELPADEEKVILDYLATNYGPTRAYRRAPLDVTFEE